MEECYPDTIEVAGSSPAVITNWFVTQLDKSTGLLHREFGVRIPAGQQRMKSSMVESRQGAGLSRWLKVRILLHPLVVLADMAVCVRLQTGRKKFESSARLSCFK